MGTPRGYLNETRRTPLLPTLTGTVDQVLSSVLGKPKD